MTAAARWPCCRRLHLPPSAQCLARDSWIRFSLPKSAASCSEFGSPLVIIDCERVRVQFRKLKKALPGVDLHYALKPMPHAAVVQTVIDEGGLLDLATSGEVQLAQSLGVSRPSAASIPIPIKRPQDIRTRWTSACAPSSPTTRTRCASSPASVRRRELLLRVSFR